MVFRTINANDTENFFHMMCRLDEETDYMMYEPGERQERTKDLNRLAGIIEEAESGGDFLICAAYVVTGIRSAYRRQGIGTELFLRLDDWAKKNGIIRLELTVECPNTAAKRLYEKRGFAVEGIKRKTMKVNGSYVDEYCMGKIIG